MFRNRAFQFSPMKTVIALGAAALCWSMGYWQYTRYQSKKAYFATLERHEHNGITEFDASQVDFEPLYHAVVRVTGVFDHSREVYLRNRSHHDQPGVKLITPLILQGSKGHILVDRGFVPYGMTVDEAARTYDRPEGVVTIEGRLRPSQDKAFFLAPEVRSPEPGRWKMSWMRVDIPVMQSQLPYNVLPVYLEAGAHLEPEYGAIEDFPAPTPAEVLPPLRHLNYVFQWTGFGIFGILLSLFLQFRPRRPETD